MTDLGKLLLAVEPDGANFPAKLEGIVGGSKVAGVFSKVGSGAGRTFGTSFAAAVAIGGVLEHIGSKFHSAFSEIRVDTGATGKALDGLDQSFKNVLVKTPAGMGDVAKSIATVNQRLGLTGPRLEGLALSVLRLSRITKTDLQGNLSSVTGLFNQWNVKGADATTTLDMLFRASQRSGVGVGELASQLSEGGVQLRAVGFDLRDSTALVALLGKAGLSASAILPALSRSLAIAAKEGKPATQVFQETFAAIRNAPNDTKAAGLALDVFGAKAGPKFAALIRSGKLSYEEFSKAIGKGDTIAAASTAVGTWQGKLAILRNELDVKLQPIATKVFDGLGVAVVKVGDFINGTFGPDGNGTKAFDWFKGEIADVQVWWGQHGDQIIGTAQKIWDGIGTGIDAIKTGVGGLVDGFDSNSAKFEGFADKVGGIWQQISQTVRPAIDLIVAVVSTGVGIVTQLWDRFGSHLVDHIVTAFNAIVDIVKGGIQLVRGVIEIVTGLITLKWGKVWQGIQDVFGGVWHVLGGLARLGLNAVSTVIGAGMAVISLAWDHIWSGLASVAAGIWGGIERSAASGVNGIISIINDLIRAYDKLPFAPNISPIGKVHWGEAAPKPASMGVNSQGIPNSIALKPGMSGSKLLGPPAPTHSAGGIAEAHQAALFGEKGPEIGVPETRMRIFPADVSRDILLGLAHRHSAQPITVNTTIEGNVYGDAHMQQLFDEHDRKLEAALTAGRQP